MSIDGFLEYARERRELVMRDQCVINRSTGEPVWDPTTGTYTPAAETEIYSGKCRIKPTFSPAEREGGGAGDREVVLQVYDIELPWGASAEVDTGDTVTVTASDDAWVIGKPMPVGSIGYAGNQTVRHVTVWAQARVGDISA